MGGLLSFIDWQILHCLMQYIGSMSSLSKFSGIKKCVMVKPPSLPGTGFVTAQLMGFLLERRWGGVVGKYIDPGLIWTPVPRVPLIQSVAVGIYHLMSLSFSSGKL